jgi:hypothetical protein
MNKDMKRMGEKKSEKWWNEVFEWMNGFNVKDC